jgi:bacteriocin-like protein
MEERMRKKTKMQKRPKSKPAETSEKKEIELSEKELEKVSGGGKTIGARAKIPDGRFTT